MRSHLPDHPSLLVGLRENVALFPVATAEEPPNLEGIALVSGRLVNLRVNTNQLADCGRPNASPAAQTPGVGKTPDPRTSSLPAAPQALQPILKVHSMASAGQ